jgi:hypothetical protein
MHCQDIVMIYFLKDNYVRCLGKEMAVVASTVKVWFSQSELALSARAHMYSLSLLSFYQFGGGGGFWYTSNYGH